MRLWNKLRTRFGRTVDADLAEEMRLHRSLLEDRYRAEGLSDSEARHRAALAFGPATQAMESSRAEWCVVWLESLWNDTRYGLRALQRDKTFAATAVLTLAVGLALASVAFTLFNAYVLRPFAVADPDSLYEVRWRSKDYGVRLHPWATFEEVRGRTDVFRDVLGTYRIFVMGDTQHWSGSLVTGNYFQMLGARVVLGRPIEESDTKSPMGDSVVVISHAVWESAYQRDPGVLGRTITLRGRPYEIIGVASAEFDGLDESPPDFWAPISMHAAFREEPVTVEVIGRLREGWSRTQAEEALAPLAALTRPDLRADLGSRATAVPFKPMMLAFFAPVILALGLVLATCCANVANMLLARGLARQREIGIRLSVGAGRLRLVRQLLTEALVIAALAGIAGILLARLMLDGGQRFFFATTAPEFAKLVRLHSLEPDYRVFVFALVLAAAAAVGAALLPALQATRPNTTTALRGEFGAGFRASTLRDGLVVFQVAICVVLLVCGALLYRRASVFQAQDTGLRQRGVVHVSPREHGREIVEALRSRPDVEAVSVSSRIPWLGRLNQAPILPSGRAAAEIAGYNVVSPGYFDVFGIRLTSGRPFTEEEALGSAPVAIVSEATARAFWPGEDPIGKTLRGEDARERHLRKLPIHGEIRVIGVAADVIHGWVFEGRDKTCIYLPASDKNTKVAKEVLVRFRGDENTSIHTLRKWLIERWPTFDGETMPVSTILSVQIYPFQAAGWIGWLLGLVAMGLSVSGMYGVMSFLVNQRAKEIGIRMALGATPGSVVSLVLRRSVWLTGAGALSGAVLAGGAVRLLLAWSAGLGVLTWDSVALFTGTLLAGVAAVTAALGPSTRAARLDPNTVLRSE